ncbi:tyrosine-type recombinase/integrase [Streptomyces sp. Je 1-4]|uniref:tyrosine-type recombinase/integrase n=1 Tax=Streptomyces explomaris TaxID=2981351 RepID=UPI00398669F6
MDAGDCAASSGRDQPSASSGRRTWPGVRASSGRSLRAEPGRHRFHVLRHTYASMMLEAGESVVTVARWLGYSSPAVTLGYYAHFMPEAGSRKPEARGAPPLTDCSRGRGIHRAGGNSPDSPQG